MKIRIAMSGGVDSTVAVLRLLEAGHSCEGAFMLLGDASGCRRCDADLFAARQQRDAEDAARSAEALGIPFRLLDYRDRFREAVTEPFTADYCRGLTPSPCVECNIHLKFGIFYEDALASGFDAIATGHYARIRRREDGSPVLMKALDGFKDQSYMLYHLSSEKLEHILFPLGEMHKEDVRQLAAERGLTAAQRGDSQDICFLPEGDYASFVEEKSGRPSPAGNFVTESGQILGKHRGLIRYTIGQRKGLGISSEAPLFVTELRPDTQEVVLSHGEGLFSAGLTADRVSLNCDAWEGFLPVQAKIRYRHTPADALAAIRDGQLILRFQEPQRAVTPGQAVVLYQGDTVLGGGRILRSKGENTQV